MFKMWHCSSFLGFLFVFLLMSEPLMAKPQPGEVYKEFHSEGGYWRVTDRDSTNPGALEHIPNTTYQITIDDLDNAIRAEAVMVRWGGHPGTSRRRIAFGYTDGQYNSVPSNSWIDLPNPTIPMANSSNPPECWIHFDNVDFDIPLSHLTEGGQDFILDCGPQLCIKWHWGQWGFYGMIIRIYYDPATKTHPTGQITAPVSGATLLEDPQVSATTSGSVERVDFIAYHKGIDIDGDGIMQEWQELWFRYPLDTYEDVYIDRHLGSDSTGPIYQSTWDTTYVPDQVDGSIKFVARVKGTNGYWYVTPIVDNLSLHRPDSSVKLYIDDDLPQNFWVLQNITKECFINIPSGDDLDNVQTAKLHWMTWAEQPADVTFNGTNTADTGGNNHSYIYTIRDLDKNLLSHGDNRITIFSDSIHHGCEVLYPGPMLTVRYNLDIPTSTVTGRHVFYNNSAWDEYEIDANAKDDEAIATDKQALLPGQTASGVNYTSYDKGINGVMVDIAGLGSGVSAADFEFHVGNDNSPGGWVQGPAAYSITVRPGDGDGGGDRITIIWADGSIAKKWLRVTVKATAATNLASPDIFFFGNAVGDTLDQSENSIVDATDEIACRNDPHNFLRPATIDKETDINRDKHVNATDELLVRNNTTDFTSDLELFTAP